MNGGGYVLERGRGYTAIAYREVTEGRPGSANRALGRERGEVDAVQVMSARSLARLRREVAALPVEMLGNRPLWMTLTVPRNWRKHVPDIDTWEGMRRRLVDRWEHQYGRLIGVWVREFQEAGAPHMHWYVALPAGVTDGQYRGLVERTLLAKQLEEEYGVEEGRAVVPTVGIQHRGRWAGSSFGGAFAMWLRRAWSEVVTGGTVGVHYARGVDVRTSYWSDGAAQASDKIGVLAYMAGEMGKARQKRVPYGFGEMRRWWGLFGRDLGFRPVIEAEALDHEIGRAVAAEMEAWVRDRIVRMNTEERAAEIIANRERRREYHGVEALGLYGDGLKALLARAAARVEAERADVAGWEA
jgi:hypothetical protein